MEAEDSILAGNKIIAEFIGLKPAFAHEKDEHGYIQTVDGFLMNKFEIPYSIKNLKYHTSWDWLMPVIAKIYDTASPVDTWMAIYDTKIWEPIDVVYKRTVDHIKYRNSITPVHKDRKDNEKQADCILS